MTDELAGEKPEYNAFGLEARVIVDVFRERARSYTVQASVMVDIHVPRFLEAEHPDNQAHPGHHHRVPQPEDIAGVHHQGNEDTVGRNPPNQPLPMW
jgi:hypothetical protein